MLVTFMSGSNYLVELIGIPPFRFICHQFLIYKKQAANNVPIYGNFNDIYHAMIKKENGTNF